MKKNLKENWISIEEKGKPKHTKDVLCRVEKFNGEINFQMGHIMNKKSDLFIIGNIFEWDMGKITHYLEIDELFF